MKNALKKWADEIMARAHREARSYEQDMQKKKDLTPVQQTSCYGRYFDGTNDTI